MGTGLGCTWSALRSQNKLPQAHRMYIYILYLCFKGGKERRCKSHPSVCTLKIICMFFPSDDLLWCICMYTLCSWRAGVLPSMQRDDSRAGEAGGGAGEHRGPCAARGGLAWSLRGHCSFAHAFARCGASGGFQRLEPT